MIDPLNVATDGYLSSVLNIAQSGYLVVATQIDTHDGGSSEDDLIRYVEKLQKLSAIVEERERKKYKVKGLVDARQAAKEVLEELPIDEEQLVKLSTTTKYTVSELDVQALQAELEELINYYNHQLSEIIRLREEDDIIALLMLI